MEPKISKSDYKGFPLYYSTDLDQMLNYGLYEALEATGEEAVSLLRGESIAKINKTYPPSVWIIKQMLEQTVETELDILQIVLAASGISKEELDAANITSRLAEITAHPVSKDAVTDFLNVHTLTVDIFNLLNEEQLKRPAHYFGYDATVLMGGFMIAAHIHGQTEALKNLYLKENSNVGSR